MPQRKTVATTKTPAKKVAAKPPTKPKYDVIEFDGNQFYNTDAVSGAIAHLPDESVDLIITDPPYGINGDKLHQHYNRDEQFVVDGYIEVPAAEYNAFTHAWVKQAERVLKPGGSIYIVSGYTNLYDVLDALRATKLEEVNHVIWKYNFGVFTKRKYVSSHYHILYYAKPGARRTFHLQARYATDEVGEDGSGSANYRDREDVWIINREYKPGQEKNKNELPKELLTRMMQYSSSEGDRVCDFFMGGCSTAVVAIGMNRKFVGFELSKPTFKSRVPQVRNVVPGSELRNLRTPQAEHQLENGGKSWTNDEIDALVSRFAELATQGKGKGEIVETLCADFKRGYWSIVKLLKKINGRLPEVRRGARRDIGKVAAHQQIALLD